MGREGKGKLGKGKKIGRGGEGALEWNGMEWRGGACSINKKNRSRASKFYCFNIRLRLFLLCVRLDAVAVVPCLVQCLQLLLVDEK